MLPIVLWHDLDLSSSSHGFCATATDNDLI
jgi:hypothetical protein